MKRLFNENEGVKKAFIIDSNVDFCLLMEFYLRKQNIEVVMFQRPELALDRLAEERPELIIADYKSFPGIEQLLQDKIDLIEGYSPRINKFDTDMTDEARAADDFWDRLIIWIKEKFKF